MTQQNDQPWLSEPNRVEFEAYGFPCLIRRTPAKILCGYVAVPPSHPLHGKRYDDEKVNLDAHGGLTFSGGCEGDICHVPKGEPDNVWWFGFDGGHGFDYIPAMAEQMPNATYERLFGNTDQYRDIEYMKNECIGLAEQLRKLA